VKTTNILALASYFKGQRFLERAHSRGAKVYLVTVEKCLRKPWPREHIADVFAMPDEHSVRDVVNATSYLARSVAFDHVVALDDFDVETAAHLREHFRIDGMGETVARFFRDKLAMRVGAAKLGVPIPEFTPIFNDEAVNAFCDRVPAPWMLKPRSQASATGIKKIPDKDSLWRVLGELGDERSAYLLEQYLAGDVYHVDSIVAGNAVKLAEVHRCGTPPFDVAHGGGIFSSVTVPRGSADEKVLQALNEKVLTKFGLIRGPSHVEFIKRRDSGQFVLLECAARVGGAHIADMVEASTGLNLWAEWADTVIDAETYALPTPPRREYGGLVVCLAREERPDTSGFADPEIVYRSPEANHVGLVVRSPDQSRAQALIDSYRERLQRDVLAVMPAPAKPSH
jgi:biotin carboxylase